MQAFTLRAFLLIMLAVVAAAGQARAETVNCTPITGLPAVITTPGIYCLKGNLDTAMTSGNAIEIQTNNVVLDLNGFKLGGLAAGAGTTAKGIYSANRSNITIKNGTVRGFYQGIVLLGDANVVEYIRADSNTFIGIDGGGTRSIIRNNQVVDTGGSTLDANADAYGIASSGARVLNNDVIDTFKQGNGVSYGIVFLSGTGGLAVNNRITQANIGIGFAQISKGKYRDNLTSDVATPFSGPGVDVGNNN